jgi:hypothetical protein
MNSYIHLVACWILGFSTFKFGVWVAITKSYITFASRSDRDHKKKHKATNERALGRGKTWGIEGREKVLKISGSLDRYVDCAAREKYFKISLDKMKNMLYFCTPFRKEREIKKAINGS